MSYEAAIVDVDGTIVRGDAVIPGAAKGLRALESRGIRLLLFSNNPTRGGPYYRDKLADYDIDVDAENVLTSATVTAEYLSTTHPESEIFLVGETRLASILTETGLTLTADPGRADVVLGSIDREFTYRTVADAQIALEGDVPFYGTDPDATIPTEEGSVPGSGAILAALEAVAGRKPDEVLGKPSPIAAAAALARLESQPGRTLVIGDRLDTDVALGNRAGMETALVQTGLATEAMRDRSDVAPDHVLESLGDVETVLE